MFVLQGKKRKITGANEVEAALGIQLVRDITSAQRVLNRMGLGDYRSLLLEFTLLYIKLS